MEKNDPRIKGLKQRLSNSGFSENEVLHIVSNSIDDIKTIPLDKIKNGIPIGTPIKCSLCGTSGKSRFKEQLK